jgi:NADP-dependent 3-hydroxy acid dehydrogenase YdfG
MEIKDKVVIITGASAGIGYATAKLFAANGANVVLAARSEDRLERLVSELPRQGSQALPVQTDMRSADSIRHMVESAVSRFGQVDALINNAGQAIAGAVAELDIEQLRQVIDLNLIGVIEAMQAVIPHMRANRGGVIANISSMVTKMNIPALGGYAATKSALDMITQTARIELAPENIRVLLVYPRMTATDFGKNSLGSRQTRQRQRSGGSGEMVIDPPEYVAEKILQAVQQEIPVQFMDSK